MQLFYFTQINHNLITLDREESRHCRRVLRKRTGDRVEVVDGKGNWFEAEIIGDKDKLCELKIITRKKDYGKRDFRISIAIAITKNTDRFEWFLEKAAEIGIDEIIPMLTEKTERTRLNIERMQKILLSAMKQSGKAFLPHLQETKKLNDVLLSKWEAEKFIAVCDWATELPHLKSAYQRGKDALILIGPEGDFTASEVKLATAQGFQPVSLGKSRLRVETAGVVACHTIVLANESP